MHTALIFTIKTYKNDLLLYIFFTVKHLGKKKFGVCMNRLHSSVVEHSLRTQEVPGSSPAGGENFLQIYKIIFL